MSKFKILIIDDNVDMSMLVKIIFDRLEEEYETHFAKNG